MAEKLVLQNQKILLTQSEATLEPLKSMLDALGARVVHIPLLLIKDPPDWQMFDYAAANLAQYHWVVFTSQNAVLQTIKRVGVPALQRLKIAVVGPSTKALVERHGLKVGLMPNQFSAQHLAEALRQYLSTDQHIWHPQALHGRTEIANALAGFKLSCTPAYQTCMNQQAKAGLQCLLNLGLDWVVFNSPIAVQAFFTFVQTPKPAKWACIGTTTQQALQKFKKTPSVVAEPQSAEGLVRGLLKKHN